MSNEVLIRLLDSLKRGTSVEDILGISNFNGLYEINNGMNLVFIPAYFKTKGIEVRLYEDVSVSWRDEESLRLSREKSYYRIFKKNGESDFNISLVRIHSESGIITYQDVVCKRVFKFNN